MTTDTGYGFDDADDNAIAAEIASMDPISIKGGNYVANEDLTNVQFPQNIPLTTFPPEVQAAIRAKAAGSAATEQRLANEEARARSLGARVKGWTNVSDPYWREAMRQENEQNTLNADLTRLELQLAEVERFDVVEDPVTGVQTPKAIEKVQGYQRKQVEAERNRVVAQLQDLNGRGGQLRLQKAMREAVAAKKAIHQQLAEEQEAKERGEAQLREERIQKRADTYASIRRNSV